MLQIMLFVMNLVIPGPQISNTHLLGFTDIINSTFLLSIGYTEVESVYFFKKVHLQFIPTIIAVLCLQDGYSKLNHQVYC